MESQRASRGTRLRVGPARLGQLVQGWLADADLSAATAARRAGVSVSTMHRVLNDAVDPSVGTLREIALACGRSLDLGTGPVADPAAAASVRVAFEPGYVTDLTGIEQWQARLRRQVDGDDPATLVEAAGTASAPLQRVSTVLLRGPVTIGRLASAGHASQASWAISGLAGFERAGVWEQAPAPTIMWTEDPRRVKQLLADAGLESTTRWQRAHVAICQGEPALFTNSFEHGHVRYVAPIQLLLDAFSIGGPVAEVARKEPMSW